MHHSAYFKEYAFSTLRITANETFIHKTGTATHLHTVEDIEVFSYTRQDFHIW